MVINGKCIFDGAIKSESPRLSRDANLNALVQLGALRLDTDRSFLSLIDGKHQYIIAEATRTHSISRDGVYANGNDGLYLGVTKLNATWGVCPNTMAVFTDDTGSTVIREENIYADKSRYIIRDMLADPHYRECPYVKGFPQMRTYAEVPLVSPLGYVIGSYCVVDNRVRQFDDAAIQVLAEICDTIITHLELMRTKQSRVRSEQLIRGLGVFMERESSLPKEEDTESSKTSEAPIETLVPERLMIVPVDPRPPTETRPSDDSLEMQPSLASSNIAATPKELTPLSTPLNDVEDNPFEQQDLTPEPTTVREPVLSLTVRSALERAATLIRKAMDVDGVAFLDAAPHGFASRSSHSTSEVGADPFSAHSGGESDQLEDENPTTCTSLARSLRYQPNSAIMAAGKSPAETGVSSSPLSEAVLQRLIRRYPRGHIFSADEYGPIDERFCPGAKINAGKTKRARRRSSAYRHDLSEIFRLRPEARFMVFLPLWHFQRECWFLAAFAWTTNPAQSFDNEDLTYLSAFGNSIMAEIARFETLAMSRAKSDFISSVSHELRSPLHGILASTELLREALGNTTHNNMLDMIESCGNTLLDTMNHLLDFAKINNLARTSSKQETDTNQPTDHGELSATSSVDLSNLVQEVVESIYLGHASKYTASTASLEFTLPGQDHSVLVTVNIERHKNWKYNVQVGAWKRIVMNLFGNALKYTRAGQITVNLRLVDEMDDSGTYSPHLYFSVRDTGIGMSPDYLKYHLFTPFAQENSLSPGTGLGLSIVKQVVTSLGGKLDVESRLGMGTHVIVLIPLKSDNSETEIDAGDADIDLHGKSICIVPPEEYSTTVTDYKAQRLAAASTAIDNIARTWLGMKDVPFGRDIALDQTPDYCFLDASLLDDSTDLVSTLPPWALLRRSKTRMVLLCYGIREGRELDLPVVRLRQPLGPNKLRAVLKDAEPTFAESPISPRRVPQMSLVERILPPFTGVEGIEATLTSQAAVAEEPTARQEQSTLSTAASSEWKSSSGTKHHILIVDDNPINAKLLSTQIQRLGHTYATAMNGLEAIQLFKDSRLHFDFIFMDISMPVMNGFEATQEIRAFEKAEAMEPSSTIVALTGLGGNLSKQEAFSSGVNVFLTKPVSLKEVRKLLDGNEE